jgi:ABC-type antimicrobial peptide transport system permease subunit
MEENRIWRLFARKLAGEATRADLEELEQLQGRHPEINKYFEVISSWWKLTEQSGKENADQAVNQLLRQLEERNVTVRNTGPGSKSPKTRPNHFVMLKNYFRVAWRHISRQKTYTAINSIGLAFGISACFVIFLITRYEFSFDKFHPDRSRIYRIVGEMQNSEGEKEFLNSPISEVAAFQDEIPGFEATAGIYLSDRGTSINIPDSGQIQKKFDNLIPNSYSPTVIITWPDYFSIFKYQWLAGSPISMKDPFKVVLTESRAKKYFGNIKPNEMIGKTVIYDDSLYVTVSGIVKDWTGNTDFGYTDFISISTATHSFLKAMIPKEDWGSLRPHGAMAFVKLAEGTTASQIDDKFAAYIQRHVKFDNPGTKLRMYLQPLGAIHFTPEFHRGDDGDDFRKAYMPILFILMGVAFFILILAAVNFINLSTAQFIQRTKEIGIRKVMGGKKTDITMQFLSEAFLITCIAVIISILIVNPILYLFKDYIPEGITLHFSDPSVVIFLIFIALLTTLLAGFYPARVSASHRPVLSLKGSHIIKGRYRVNLRKSLIVFQFTVSLIFIIGTFVMVKQIKFMSSADKGFNTDAIITINKWGDQSGKLRTLAETVKHISGVDKVILQGNAPMGFAQMTNSFRYQGQDGRNLNPLMEIGDEGYIPFYQMKLVAGRNLAHSDSLNEVVINQTFANSIGFENPSDAVGKLLYYSKPAGWTAIPIVGVIADFHQASFHDMIQPAVIGNMKERAHSIAVKLSASEKSTTQVKKTIANIEREWKKLFPESDFNYSFLNESISWLYGQEEKTAWLAKAAMIIAIFISCMGIFGLGMFTAQRRRKEIGIRKTLGASVTRISTMLSREFIILVGIGFVIASPVAYYLSNKWLEDFVYRTKIDIWVFALAGLAAVVIAIFTVSFQAIKAAIANPVKSLRDE